MRPELKKYFQKNNNGQLIFMGEKMVVLLPQRYEDKGNLVISDKVKTLAVFEMIIDDKHNTGLTIPAQITMIPSEVKSITIDDEKYYRCLFRKGNVFLNSTHILRSDKYLYSLFVDVMNLGRMPSFLSYDQALSFFEEPNHIAKLKFESIPTIFEMVIGHLFRDKDDPSILYRYTDKKKKPIFIGIKSVTYGTPNTVSKVVGSRFSDALESSVNKTIDEYNPIETVLRL
jgi:hypothetical protein